MISKLLAGVIDKDTLPLYMMSDSNKLQRIWWAKSLEWHDSHSLIFNIQTLWGSGNSSPFVHTIELKKKKKLLVKSNVAFITTKQGKTRVTCEHTESYPAFVSCAGLGYLLSECFGICIQRLIPFPTSQDPCKYAGRLSQTKAHNT